ncbi:MAG: hypothetical protein JW860_14140 [Sedimentisphaerales bacterium]|nr:hypothetical protein [Sedimentisphaerales bacterium]
MNSKTILFISLCLCLVFVLVGCQTLSGDKEMQMRRFSRVSDLNRRMMAEDMEAVLLLDKPSSLSRWQIK